MARRLAVGLDPQRLALLLAVLHRHGGIETAGFDVFVNAVGGVRIAEPAADLAVTLAVYSSLRNKPLPKKALIFGEIGLAGEVRESDFSVLAPIDDVRGTAAYRLDAAVRLTQRALRELGDE